MKVKYIAYDSLGVKSMCTQVKTSDTTITIDPGVSIETDSYPVPKEKREKLVEQYHDKIKKSCEKSEFIIISHYHYDHHLLDIDFYKDKKLIVKDPEKNINQNQRKRGLELMKYITGEIDGIGYGDDHVFMYGAETVIWVSEPMWHGKKNTKLGYVLMLEITDSQKRFLYSSDLSGVCEREQAQSIISRKPDILVLDGFPTYLLGYVSSYKNLKSSIENINLILEKTECETYILDHHLLRDYRFQQIYYEVYEKAKELGKNVLTAAEAQGKKPMVLEGYAQNGPTKWKNWDNLTFEKLDEMIKNAKKKK
ncbi:MAG: hypothetical protein B6U97_02355 [Candidatus Altiarchaeales archaeon ex4484_96]|nr:MAG: hypothetical protein B6U97_02355 [Candidatus Altiarchaeales archaeon ex4484_96]